MLFCNQQYYSMNIQKITLERCFLYKGVCEVPSKKKRQKDINIRSFPKKCSIWLPDRVTTFVVWVGGRARRVSQAYRCHQLWPLAPKAHWLEGEWEVVGPQEASSDSSWPKTWVSLEAESFAGWEQGTCIPVLSTDHQEPWPPLKSTGRISSSVRSH